jgi:glycerophosphoryl diester phosphodiesterase
MLITALLIFFAVCIIIGFLIMPSETTATQRAPFWGVNHAHRGLYNKEQTIPENSIAAFSAAIDEGYGIELDIQLSSDEEVVVFHDDDLKRICGQDGRVDSFTFEQLKKFKLFATDYEIPHLLEVLQLVNGRVPLIIELKSCKKYKILCKNAWRILRQYDGDICIESFDTRIVHWFKKNVPGLLRGQLAARPSVINRGILGYLIGLGLVGFWGRPNFIAYHIGPRPLFIRLAMRFGMSIAWTANENNDADKIEDAYDAVIFEHYKPLPRYVDAPIETSDEMAEKSVNIDDD